MSASKKREDATQNWKIYAIYSDTGTTVPLHIYFTYFGHKLLSKSYYFMYLWKKKSTCIFFMIISTLKYQYQPQKFSIGQAMLSYKLLYVAG